MEVTLSLTGHLPRGLTSGLQLTLSLRYGAEIG